MITFAKCTLYSVLCTTFPKQLRKVFENVISYNSAQWFACAGGYLLLHAKKVESLQEGKDMVLDKLSSTGEALWSFKRMLTMQGVSPAVCETVGDWLPQAPFTTRLYCPTAGCVLY